MPPPHDPLGLIGTTVEKYEIQEVAGEGGFSVVYKAEHLIWHQPVAIKFFSILEDAKPELREKLLADFIQEGKLMTELSSKSAAIVQARDIGKLDTPDGGWIPYMVLEWLEGDSLDRVVKAEQVRGLPPRSIAEAVRLLEPAAIALEVAHQHKVAHRDLKPANIMIMGNPRATSIPVKVLDFGIAKVMGEHAQLQEQLHLTGQQITAFTPNYGAPEQFSRSYGATGPWTDVFAMALIVLELLRGGTKALEGDTYFELGVASCDPTKRPTPRQLGLDVSAEVDAVFAKALALQPADRYPSMGAFWGELFRHALPGAATWQPVITGSSVTSSNPDLDPDRRSISVITAGGANPDSPTVANMSGPIHASSKRSRTPLVAAGAIAVAALVAASMFFLGNGGNSGTAPAATGEPDASAATPAIRETIPEPEPEAEPEPVPPVDPSAEPSASATAAPSPRPQGGPLRPPPPPKPEPEPGKDAWDPSNFGGR